MLTEKIIILVPHGLKQTWDYLAHFACQIKKLYILNDIQRHIENDTVTTFKVFIR